MKVNIKHIMCTIRCCVRDKNNVDGVVSFPKVKKQSLFLQKFLCCCNYHENKKSEIESDSKENIF
jgi:hypothetical protein